MKETGKKAQEYQQQLIERNKLLVTIMDNAPVGIWLNSLDGIPIIRNRWVTENIFMPLEEWAVCKKTDQEAFSQNKPCFFEESMTFKDGKKHMVQTVKVRIVEDDGKVLGVLGIGLDITEKKNSELALKRSEEKYRLVAENTSDVIWVFNLNKNRFSYISPSIQQLVGYTVEEVMAQSMERFLAPESLEIITKKMTISLNQFIKNPQSPQNNLNEVQQICKNGETIWVEMSTKFRYNSLNEIEAVGVSRNIEKRKKAEKEVLYLSYHDQLTGLYNRRFYEEELNRLDTERNLPISIIVGDVNGLKLTNDVFGHNAGDILLKKIATVFKRVCRADDIIARTGGDEFAILLPKTKLEEAQAIISRIKKEFSKENIIAIQGSISMGCETKMDFEQDLFKIMEKAENKMYLDKTLNRSDINAKMVHSLIETLHKNFPREKEQSCRVSSISQDIGEAMGLSEKEIKKLKEAGFLHNIGKIALSYNMQSYPIIGYRILNNFDETLDLAEAILAQHENWDGTGYPKGLKDKKIPELARIIGIAQAFVEMTNNLSNNVMSNAKALQEIQKQSGIKFDPEIVDAFIDLMLGN
ncbi:MAG: diguanylate cyclase [Desulfitobacteriaceae bacterium]|nr:diguanylate cyclase [Desulfitobacteriaceae bacterium]